MAKSRTAKRKPGAEEPTLGRDILQGLDELRRHFAGEDVGLKVTRVKLAPLARVLAQLKIAREDAGLSLAEVARRSGVRFETISRLELGKVKNPTIDTLQKIADAIGVDLRISVEKRR